MKKTVYECEFCLKWVKRDDIRKFKETKFSNWEGKWVRTKFDICWDCKQEIGYLLYKKRKERDKESAE